LRTPQAVIDIPGFLCHGATTFSPAVKKLMYGHKFYAQPENTPKLAALLVDYWQRFLPQLENVHPENVLVVSLPPHAGERDRVAPMASRFARHFGYEYQPQALVWAKDIKPQHTIHDKRQRFLNVSMSLAVDYSLISEHARILIVDDITTTGATLHEASRVFHGERLRAKRLDVITLAVTKVPFGLQTRFSECELN
jgi:predicted amidophosphoribosyltransferase